MEHFIWVEKYRPQTVDEIVLEPIVKDIVKQMIATNQINHLMLHGISPGTGKTSLARLLVKNLDCDFMELNASNENNVETMRTKVVQFCSTLGFSPLKIIILSEADGLTNAAQFALKDIIEEFSATCRFIFTLNNIGKMLDPIVSRCQKIEFKNLPENIIKERLSYILNTEKIQYDEKVLDYLIQVYYPDFRQILNTIQSHVSDNKLNLDIKQAFQMDAKFMIIQMLKDRKKYTELFEYIKKNRIVNFHDIMRSLFDKVEYFSKEGKEVTNLVFISEAMYRSSTVIDQEVNFLALILKLTENNK